MAMFFFKNKLPLPEHLNICLVANKFPIKGRSADHGFLWPVAKGLVRNGHNVQVIAWSNPKGTKLIQQDGVTVHYLGGYGAQLKSFPELVRQKFLILHKKNPFHIVHSIDSSGYRIGAKKKQYKVAMSYDVEATQMAKIFRILGMSQETIGGLIRTGIRVAYKFLTTYFNSDRRLLKTADGVFVTSPLQRIILERYYLFPDYRTFSVPYGIEIGDLKEKKQPIELREQLGLPENARTVVTLTDMTELEEVKNVLKAFEKLAIKKHSARLIIIGDGPLRKEIEFEMFNLALGSRVIFTGAIANSDIGEYIALSNVFVNISSRSTGFEPSLLEAMSQKKVIIGSEVSPMSTIVEDGIDGFLIRPADVSTLSSLLVKIFEEQLPVDEIGENAQKKVNEIFDMSTMVNTTMSAYYQTLVRTGYYCPQDITS